MKSLAEILKGWGEVGVKALQTSLQKVNATGKTIASIRYDQSQDQDIHRLTFYGRDFIRALETGISPTTKGPSREMIESLTEYARARGFSKPESAAWALAKKIQKEGDKTHKKGGRIVYSDIVTQLAEDIKKDVKKHYRTKFIQTIKGGFN